MADILSIENGHLEEYESQDATKLRGGYYTSSDVADWLCKWAIRDVSERVLEPACGDGVFLSSALERFVNLGAKSPAEASAQLTAVEVVPQEARLARERLLSQFGSGVNEVVQTNDFFASWTMFARNSFDAVVGNPPFIRYQNFPEPFRSRAMNIMTDLGLKPNRLTNIWVPFVVASVASLRPGGRLAFILPAELLQVSYAAQLRSFLAERFATIDIIACNELFFEKAEQEVLLLLADCALTAPLEDNSCRVTMTEASSVSDIIDHSPKTLLAQTTPKTMLRDNEKWLKYFLDDNDISLMRELREAPEITTLHTFAGVDVGVVTGRNSFFVLNRDDITRYGLQEYSVPIVSRTDQLRGAHITSHDWRSLSEAASRVHLLHLSPLGDSPVSGFLERYIQMGEEQGVNEGYKCSIRSPWYAVPSVWQPHAFLFRQIYDFPRAVLNQASATSTDTIHRMKCKVQPELLVSNLYTYLTGASAEIEGRSYGGGVLELEPSEAEHLLVPGSLTPGISLEECDRLIRSGRLEDLLEENSKRILVESIGLSERECLRLRDIWLKMRYRRSSRRRRRSRSLRST